MDFDVEIFLKLLKKLNEYKSTGKPLDDWENIEEINIYNLMFIDTIFYQNCKEYWQILQSFLNNDINIKELSNQWTELNDLNKEKVNELEKKMELENFEFNEESYGFSLITTYLELVMLEFNSSKNILINEGMNDELYRLFLKKNLLPKILPYYEAS